MTTTPLLVRLPDELVRRFRRTVPVRQRSKFIQRLLEDAIPPSEGDEADPLYRTALSVEADAELASEMQGWEAATIADGLDAPQDRQRNGRTARK